MLRSFSCILMLVPALMSAASLRAQQSGVFDSIRTPRGNCGVWIGIPGFSNHETDRSYASCAVDRPVELRSEASLPQPWISTSIGGQFTVVVNADGTVEPRLTRAGSLSMDSVAYRRTLEALRQWRFRPAVRAGEAVRSGFILHIRTDQRVDTLPAELRWTYRQFPFGEDSLVGRWITLPARPAPLAEEQRDSLYAALFRRLIDMRVLSPWLGRPYCIVAREMDSVPDAHARLSRTLQQAFDATAGTSEVDPASNLDRARGGVARTRGCEGDPSALRVFLPGLHRTEGNRVVFSPAGDYLADWPPGYQGATFSGWTARCVMDVPPRAPVRVHCDVAPRQSYQHARRLGERKPSPRWYQPGDSIHVLVVARMSDALQTDTLRGLVLDLRRFSRSAVLDPDSVCAWTWSAFTEQGSGSQYVVHGDLEGRSDFAITEVRTQAPPPRPQDPHCTGPRDSVLAVFFLGDLGDPVRSPVSLCSGPPLCTRRYEVDPTRHTLAERAAVRFNIQELRELTRVGDQLRFRIYVDPVPEGLMPLVLVRHGARRPYSIWPARRVELGAWDFSYMYDPATTLDSEISIYLVAR